jgi:hypothetical protein
MNTTITDKFRAWVRDIKNTVEDHIGEFATVSLEEFNIDKYPLVIHFKGDSGGPLYHMSFDKTEYYLGDTPRNELVQTRFSDVAELISDEIDLLTEIRDALKQ